MFYTYRLPDFLDYLANHYQQLYYDYVGRLTELFPSFQATDDNLVIAEDNKTSEEEDQYLLQLWKKYIG